MIENREWVFRVACEVAPEETVCVVGNSDSLGQWNSQRMVPLHPEPQNIEGSGESMWSTSIQVPFAGVEYRYCVAILLEESALHDRANIVRRWETNLLPRTLQDGVMCPEEPQVEKFGSYGGFERVDQGWLVKDSVVQLRLCNSTLYNDPVMLFKKKYKNKKVRVKVTPIELSTSSPPEPHTGGTLLPEESSDFDISNLRIKNKPIWPVMEVAVMEEDMCKFHPQEQFGVVCNNGDFVVFQCRLLKPDTNAFLCDFYIEEGEGIEVPKYLGCSYVLPSNLKDKYGVATLPITSPKHMPIGQLTVHYMVVCPMLQYECDMSVSYTRHWKDSWKGLEVGHRGAGNSYHPEPKSCANIRENTVASLKYAADSGADMVEFDVQLSKDLVPVIYHDFHACIALKRKRQQDQSDILEIPIKDLTLAQLQALKLYHKKEQGLSRFEDEEFEDHQPFPTLQKALECIPYTCGFNVEVKWTMLLRDGTYELQHPFELNHFLDLIIKMVLEHSGKRKIVFSCFHPDICTMVRLKQNRYPVIFLTQGSTIRWPSYEDQRCSSIRQAILYAINADILGINVHSEGVMRDPSEVQVAMERNLIVFCWGDHNNDQEAIKFLKKVGLHGIIYDKIDVYNTKDKKESIFLCEEREASAAMMSASQDMHWKEEREQGDKKKEEDEIEAAAGASKNLPPSYSCKNGSSGTQGMDTGACDCHTMSTSCSLCRPTSFTGILTS
ncbi:hypothetical protein Pmani_030296 [Petrolisthes manimaculis]|uniref:Glycerophosphocholine phosphodiesterase GPCPD1 n=1 Tax=Petrolisthes manimaculis TaxID=1843537 RepID=A0AAE1TW24_9EUCA|nr:hypothetical protein Pmani_030296 [Petrolisthes manimaculis]